MSTIIKLSDYRKQDAPKEDPSFECQGCKSDRFKLLLNGDVRCAGCAALIRNLRVGLIR